MASATRSAGNQNASSSSSLIPSLLSTAAGSIAVPVSSARRANEAMIARRESISVMSRSNPTGARVIVPSPGALLRGQHPRPGGQQARDEQDTGEREEHREGNGPAAGGRMQQAHLQRARACQQVPDRLRQRGQRRGGRRVRRPGHSEEDGEAQRGVLARAEDQYPHRGET